MTIQLFNIDCMEYMSTQPDNAFDLAIVDPPYGIKQDGHRENNRSKLAQSKKYHDALWNQPPPSKEYFEELRRVSTNQIVWGGNHLAEQIGQSSPCWIVWNKNTSGHFADCELAYTSFLTAVRMFNYTWNGMIQGKHGNHKLNEVRIHPTQKPVKLYHWILNNYAKKGQIILDTHLGSGSSAIAAYYLGFDFVGCELDPVYYKDGKQRVDAETSLTALGF